jgi:hypothetical protein
MENEIDLFTAPEGETVSAKGRIAIGSGYDVKIPLMLEFMERQGTEIWTVGKLLAYKFQGATIAQHMCDGTELPAMESITTINGTRLPLESPLTLSFDSITVWGCPACNSAHASGIHPSKPQHRDAVKLAANNVFYYSPLTREVFTISETCWKQYVVGKFGAKGKETVNPEIATKGYPKRFKPTPPAKEVTKTLKRLESKPTDTESVA